MARRPIHSDGDVPKTQVQNLRSTHRTVASPRPESHEGWSRRPQIDTQVYSRGGADGWGSTGSARGPSTVWPHSTLTSNSSAYNSAPSVERKSAPSHQRASAPQEGETEEVAEFVDDIYTDLKRVHSKFTEELNKKTAELESMKKENSRLQNYCDFLQRTDDSLHDDSAERETLSAEVAELQSRLSRVTHTETEIRSQLESLVNELETSQSKNAESVSTLEKEISRLKGELQEKESHIIKLEATVSGSKQPNLTVECRSNEEYLSGQLVEYMERCKSANRLLSEQTSTLERRDEEIEQLQAMNREHSAAIQGYNKEISYLKGVIKNFEASPRQVERQTNQAQESRDVNRSDDDALRKEIKARDARIQELSQSLTKAEHNLSVLTNSRPEGGGGSDTQSQVLLAEKDVTIAQLGAKIESLTRNVSDQEHRLSAMLAASERERSEKQSYLAEINKLKDEAKALRAEKNSILTALASESDDLALQGEVDSLNRELSTCHAKLNQMNDELTATRQKCTELEGQLRSSSEQSSQSKQSEDVWEGKYRSTESELRNCSAQLESLRSESERDLKQMKQRMIESDQSCLEKENIILKLKQDIDVLTDKAKANEGTDYRALLCKSEERLNNIVLERTTLASKVSVLEGEILEAQTKASSAAEELQSLKGKLLASQLEMANQVKKYEVLVEEGRLKELESQTQINSVKDHLATAEQQVAILKKELETTSATLEDVQEEKDKLELDAAEIQTQLAQLSNSERKIREQQVTLERLEKQNKILQDSIPADKTQLTRKIRQLEAKVENMESAIQQSQQFTPADHKELLELRERIKEFLPHQPNTVKEGSYISYLRGGSTVWKELFFLPGEGTILCGYKDTKSKDVLGTVNLVGSQLKVLDELNLMFTGGKELPGGEALKFKFVDAKQCKLWHDHIKAALSK